MRMTKTRLVEIGKRLNKASKGPWRPRTDEQRRSWITTTNELNIAEIDPVGILDADQREADCVFMAHARSDVPDLLKEILRLRGHLELITECCRKARTESYDPGSFPREIEKMVSLAISTQ